MSRILKTSGFLGLTAMMVLGLYQNYLSAFGGGTPDWMVGGHAHLGVLSILAIVLGFAVDAYAMEGTIRSAVVGLFVVGQWGLPLTVLVAYAFAVKPLLATGFLWGSCLVVAMLVMVWQAATTESAAFGQDRARLSGD